MSDSWSCPENYTKVTQELKSRDLHLCVLKKIVQLQINNVLTNFTYVADVTSDAESAKLLMFTTILCVLLVLMLVVN